MIKKLRIKQIKVVVTAFVFSYILFLGACKKDDNGNGNLVKERTVEMDTKLEIPTVANRTEKGTASLKLYSDSTLNFKISVSNLDGTDQLTLAHIHTGGPVDEGSPVILLVDNSTIKFQGSSASGTVKLNSSQFNAVKDGGDFYVNVHSTKLPLGLVRGQLDKTFTFAQNIDLTPISNPLRPETGLAILRMTTDSTLFYKVTVSNLTEGDILGGAQISVGAAGVSGPPIVTLYSSGTEFDMPKSVKLTGSQANFLLTSPVYITVNSDQMPTELIRGQIR